MAGRQSRYGAQPACAGRRHRVDVDELEALRDDPPIAGCIGAAVDDGVLQVDEDPRRLAGSVVVDEDRALSQQACRSAR